MNSPDITHWYPFRSKEVKEIYDHMTSKEAEEFNAFGAKYGSRMGLIVGISTTAVGFTVSEISWGFPFHLQITIAISSTLTTGLLVGYFYGRNIRMKLKELLCSTDFAKQKGYLPHTLKVYSF